MADGVAAGIGDYGNKLGLPTVNGAVIYDEGYLGNPLVFCGCAGLAPRNSHPTAAQPGDLIVALGGRPGSKGLVGPPVGTGQLSKRKTVQQAQSQKFDRFRKDFQERIIAK